LARTQYRSPRFTSLAAARDDTRVAHARSAVATASQCTLGAGALSALSQRWQAENRRGVAAERGAQARQKSRQVGLPMTNAPGLD
jgi:hypothetical protein